MARRGVFLAVVLAAAAGLGQAGRTAAQGPLLELTGSATLNEVDAAGGEKISASLELRNAGAEEVRITRAVLFLANEGGWSSSLGDMLRNGKLFGADPVIPPHATYRYRLGYQYSTPVTHVLMVMDLARGDAPPVPLVTEIPVRRAGYASPPDHVAAGPLFLGLQGPVETLPLSTGERWMPFVGQFVNGTGKPFTLQRWRMVVRDADGKELLNRDLTSTLSIRDSKEPLERFNYGWILPSGTTRGTLVLEAEGTAGDGKASLRREESFGPAEPVALQSPVSGRWRWGNGPGELRFHTHYAWPEQRYAYDLVAFRPTQSGRISTRDGDAGKNESYFAWNQPIRAAAEGEVVEVIDDVPDNLGSQENPENTPRRNSRIVVRHPGDWYTGYFHVRKGSAAVKAGDKVKAGQELGRVGNAGFSSEPHLHFTCFRYDATGRVRAVPMAVTGLKSRDGAVVTGVPRGGEEYAAQ